MPVTREELISAAFHDRERLHDAAVREAVFETMEGLDRGQLRVAEKVDGAWKVNAWIKEAVLLYFVLAEMKVMELGPFEFYDKIPLKSNWKGAGVRVVPPGTARYGSFLEPGVILMPGYVNIGARVGAGSMVDTWATVGSCAQIGQGVHLSGGVGIGGVLEPPGASPVIVEDGAFIGSRSIVVEGVVVEQEAVLGANVVLTASTRIVDVSQDQPRIFHGRVPARAVIIPGTMPKRFPAGEFGVACALMIGYRQASTDRKTSLNAALREFAVDA
ncbi:MAG: 2,3,4,5-tetrahydropyridine-2,6-dicarboxylate N-succinyltransferase [Armatimonadetes bacterium]|nr:2,3,4,5-tetrahydropyridine-2,6-dicarboxylate N-succinyltransferase [Armatimonadota bacterium]